MSNAQINLIIDGICRHLFRKENERLDKARDEIIRQNLEASGGTTGGFFFMGMHYGQPLYKGAPSSLHPSLVQAMNDHIKDRRTVLWDKDRVKQSLLIALKDARTLQDIRDSLPNGIAEMIDQIKDMPRTRPEGFLLESQPRQHAQYFKLREKMEFYLAVRLLY
jgi:hypothetical protein